MPGMLGYLLKRGIDRIILVLAVVTLQFVLLRVIPIHFMGVDPSAFLIEPGAPPEVEKLLRAQFGLDEPIFPHQYVRYALNLFTGQFGYSFITGRPVMYELIPRLINTVILDSFSLVGIWAIALALGLYAARKRGSRTDSTIVLTAIWSYIMPGWLMGLILLYLLAWYPRLEWNLKLFPIAGTKSPFLPPDPLAHLLDYLWHLALPWMAVVIAGFGSLTYYMRTITIGELRQDYVTTAKAKGLPEGKIMRRYVLKNVSPPILTILALALPGIVSGGVIIENIFSWYGTGRYLFQAISAFDYPAVQAMLFIITVFTAISLWFLDIAIAYLDPRVKLR